MTPANSKQRPMSIWCYIALVSTTPEPGWRDLYVNKAAAQRQRSLSVDTWEPYPSTQLQSLVQYSFIIILFFFIFNVSQINFTSSNFLHEQVPKVIYFSLLKSPSFDNLNFCLFFVFELPSKVLRRSKGQPSVVLIINWENKECFNFKRGP